MTAPTSSATTTAGLREAEVFSRYLVGREASPALCERYLRAISVLNANPCDAGDAWALGMAIRWPWTIGPLDAACALRHPGWALRRRLVLLSAILEASTAHTDDYMPQRRGVGSVIAVCVVEGVAAVVNLAMGMLLLASAPREARA